jgi:protocatechuate 3,4-dioxygenase beta subunit
LIFFFFRLITNSSLKPSYTQGISHFTIVLLWHLYSSASCFLSIFLLQRQTLQRPILRQISSQLIYSISLKTSNFPNMKFTTAIAMLGLSSSVVAHPEKLTSENLAHQKREVGVATAKCAKQLEARKAAMLEARSERLLQRRVAAGNLGRRDMMAGSMHKRNELKYTTIQNTTCALAPETVWGPYAVDGELKRHDLRETQEGIDFYFDIGVLDLNTCEPLPNAALTIWACNATGSYSSYTGIDPDSSELLDGWSKRTDGTTDDETFLRGIQITDSNGMAEFLTKFPGYYTSRTTHIHVTVQSNTTAGTSYSVSGTQHLGQVFFDEALLAKVYAVSPYSAHLATLNRTTNAEDSLYASASADGYNAMVSVEMIGDSIEDGLVGYVSFPKWHYSTAAFPRLGCLLTNVYRLLSVSMQQARLPQRQEVVLTRKVLFRLLVSGNLRRPKLLLQI